MNESSTLSAEVVNAFVDPVIDVLRTFIGIEAQPSSVGLTDRLDPPPSMVCSIQVSGRLVGPISWVFTEEMAALFASKFVAGEAMDALAESTCVEAVSEVANICLGNATGRLSDAGYAVQVQPPRVHGPLPEERELPRRALTVWLDTNVGKLKLVIGVRVAGGRV